ncbi:MAG: hypothetical protein M1479_07005 [Actinobacteria bacterium]|nr:hypothetical protein [Actinomycetota bacterium]
MMNYKGKYEVFNLEKIKTFNLSVRPNKVNIDIFLNPQDIIYSASDIESKIKNRIDYIANCIVSSRSENKPVVIFTGAHIVKNGLSLLLIDLIKRNLVTLVAGNGATAIHDFEICMIGETSEDIPKALDRGLFGMAYEFILINNSLSIGNRMKLGFGEALGRTINDECFREKVVKDINIEPESIVFKYPEFSIISNCYKENIPFTVHVGIGTDVIDQHPSFNGENKGGCSGRDFLIFVNELTKFTNGGVFLNIGSAVTGPEVLLKSISMATNIGFSPSNLVTADFDMREEATGKELDENYYTYYFRDQKSIVRRIPESLGGQGFYIKGNIKKTIPYLYKKVVEKIKKAAFK